MGKIISLLHATRGRAVQAMSCRAEWLAMAWDPETIEHLFAVDDDDQESISQLNPAVIVPAGGGCVRAWNAAAVASTGQVLVQLSDDWFPPLGWDRRILEAFAQDITLPRVLWIDDGARKDKLLCMAILTRKRWEDQGRELFCPEYKSIFSDTEFSCRAWRDGVVIPARQLLIEHRHPFFQKAVWDATYEESSNLQRFREGRKIYERRNPNAWHPNVNRAQIPSEAW